MNTLVSVPAGSSSWPRFRRGLWISCLGPAIPAVIACASIAYAALGYLTLPGQGSSPIEVEPAPLLTWQKAMAGLSLITLALAWGHGICFACRSNAPAREFMPFLLNLLPAAGLLFLALIQLRSEGQPLDAISLYLITLILLLLTGLLSALASDRRTAHPAS